MVHAIKGLWRRSIRRLPGESPPIIKQPDYAERYGITLADWLLYHQEQIHFKKMRWLGVKILKNPLDCWIYQEILWDVRPDVVVEIGSLAGGSTLFLCHILDLLGHGSVVSVDIDRSRYQASHSRLTDITGDCADPAVVEQVHALCRGRTTLLVHDADHTKDSVLRDLRHYADLISVGSYLIVEDGIVDVFGGPSSKRMRWDNQPGPLAAVREFLAEDQRFVIDHERERYLITSNPCGFLRRVK